MRNPSSTKWIIATLVVFQLLYTSFSISGQEKDDDNGGQADTIHKPEVVNYPKLMIIPYPNFAFMSDFDIFLDLEGIEQGISGKSYANSLIRGSIDRALFDYLLVYFDISRISFYKNPQALRDLDYIYNSIAYVPKRERIRAIYRNFPTFSIFQILSSGKNRWGVNCINQEDVIPVVKNPKIFYNDLDIRNESLIPYLNDNYQCDYYLFINGVEIKTRFKVCMNLMQNIYQKDLLLHFTLIDHNGEKVTGGIVGTTYEPSRFEDTFMLVEKNVGVLAALVEMVIREDLNLTLRYDLW